MATYKVHFDFEKDWYIEAESEEELDQKLDRIDWSSIEEKIYSDGFDKVSYEIEGDTDKEADYELVADRDYGTDLYQLY